MEIIDKKRFDETLQAPGESRAIATIDDKEIKSLIKDLEKPTENQKELAATLKVYLKQRTEIELKKLGILSQNTLKFMQLYNDTLDKLHKNLYGEKRVNLTAEMSLSQLASLVRSNQTNKFMTEEEIQEAKFTIKEKDNDNGPNNKGNDSGN